MAELPKISNLLIGFVIFFMLVAGGVGILGNFIIDRPQMLGNNSEFYKTFNSTFNQQAALNTKINSLSGNITNAQIDPGDSGGLAGLIYKSWQTIKQMPVMFGFLITIVGNIGTVIPDIPTWATIGASGILIIIIVFTIWGAIFQRDL